MIEDDIEDACAKCGKLENSAANLTGEVFLVNTDSRCGHKFCSSCKDREFYSKRQFACPKCKTIVTKLSEKSLEEVEAERDYSIRKRLKSIFNKAPSEFPTDFEYKNYEEKLEDLIYSLLNRIGVEETNAFIESYKRDNANTITLNQFKKLEEIKLERSGILAEEDMKSAKLQEYQNLDKQESMHRKEVKRHNNQIMLGEIDGSAFSSFGGQQQQSVSASAAPGSFPAPAAVTAANAAQVLFMQRPEPTPVNAANLATGRAVIQSTRDLREMHRVGGYDHSNYELRNWNEINSQLC